MAINRWIGVSGDWSTASDWSAGAVPGPSDEAVMAAPGSYTVTVATSESVGSIVLNDPGAILDIHPVLFQTGTLDVSGSVVIQAGTLELQGDRGGSFFSGILAIGGSLDVRSGGTLFLDGGTIEGGSLIIRKGGALEASAAPDFYDEPVDYSLTSTLQNVTVLGGLTLKSGSLELSGTTTIENSTGTGPGAITLNGPPTSLANSPGGGAFLLFAENYTLYKLTLNGGWVGGDDTTVTVGKGGVVEGYGGFVWGNFTELALQNDGTINSNVNGQWLNIIEMPFVNDGLVLASRGGNVSINWADEYAGLGVDDWSNNADGKIRAIDGGTLQLAGKVTNYGLISGVNSTVYFGGPYFEGEDFLQNPGDIVVKGGELFLGGPSGFSTNEWSDSGLIATVGAATDVLGGGTISAGGTMSIRGGSLSGLAPLEDDGQLKLRDASVDLSSLTIGAGGELSGFGTVAGSTTNLGTIDASKRKLDLQGAVTGDGQLHIDNKATLGLGGPTAEATAFEGKRGTLLLDLANDFTGTVAGMAGRDGIDLANFAFSSHPSITSVVGTGAAGSTTDVTITDASLSTTIHLLNQYANQFAVSASAYTVTSDHPGSASAGTLFTLASPHHS
jgi:hypothetical protein